MDSIASPGQSRTHRIGLLARAQPSNICIEPFPHLVINEALDPELYAALASSFPRPEVVAGPGYQRRQGNNRRYSAPAWSLLLREDLHPVWQAFLQLLVSKEFFATVLTAFAGHWDRRLLPLLTDAELQRSGPGLLYRDSFRDFRVLADARVEINSPVRDVPSSPRGAHLDTPNRVYSALFYFRDERDDSTGGDLELFRWKSRPSEPIDVFELPRDDVERVSAIPYRPNQLVLFPQSVSALHGVGIRHPTPHIRRYLFITAELEEDWLTEPHGDTVGTNGRS